MGYHITVPNKPHHTKCSTRKRRALNNKHGRRFTLTAVKPFCSVFANNRPTTNYSISLQSTATTKHCLILYLETLF